MEKKEAAKIRKQNQRKRDIERVSHSPNVTLPSENVTPVTELGLTVESMKPSDRELWNKHGFDCRTQVYLECLGRQR